MSDVEYMPHNCEWNVWIEEHDKQIKADAIDEFINKLEKELLTDEVKENLLSKSQVGVVIGCARFLSEQVKENK